MIENNERPIGSRFEPGSVILMVAFMKLRVAMLLATFALLLWKEGKDDCLRKMLKKYVEGIFSVEH